MSLELTINNDIKSAMIAKDKDRLRALRAIKSAILIAQTAADASAEISREDELKILNKLAKQRRDSMQIYKDQSREDLFAVEEQELNVIAEYLPEQMSEEDVKTVIQEIVSNSGASSMADMGKVMGQAMGKLNGKADGKVISSIVKELLS